jgi:hypothetical protein
MSVYLDETTRALYAGMPTTICHQRSKLDKLRQINRPVGDAPDAHREASEVAARWRQGLGQL